MPADITPRSITSSLEVHPGSATANSAYTYEENNHNPRTFNAHNVGAIHERQLNGQQSSYSETVAQHRATNGAFTNSVYQTNGTTYGTTSYGATSYATPTSYSQPEAVGGLNYSASSHGSYYLQPLYEMYPQGATVYASELTLEEDPNPPLPALPTTSNSYQQSASINVPSVHSTGDSIQTSGPTRSNLLAGGATSYSPTTRRWSVEHFSDECIRLGIPCHAVHKQRGQQHEHDQDDHAYTDSTYSYY